jgi:hypothetical protein
MPRGGLSSDPAIAERQRAALAAGRAIAAERRKAGLPPKRRQSPGSPPATTTAGTTVVPGTYDDDERGRARGGATRSKQGRAGERPATRRQTSRREHDAPPELSGFWRFYARLIGAID